MSKRYHDLTFAEKLVLTGEQFEDSVKIEAIHRGIKPAITMPDLLQQAGFTGYRFPGEAAVFYEVCVTGQYSGITSTGIGFQTPERARAALDGAFHIGTDGYGETFKHTVRESEFTVREVRISLLSPKDWNSKVKLVEDELEPFEKLVEECTADLSKVRQADYDRCVRKTKRAEYLRLSGNNEEIAKAFWSKTEGGHWPEEDGSLPF